MSIKKSERLTQSELLEFVKKTNQETLGKPSKSTQYYLTRYERFVPGSSKPSWNWSAFLLTPIWLLYRKMYAYWAGFNLLVVVAMVLEDWVNRHYILSRKFQIPSFVFGMAFFMFGNAAYFDLLQRRRKKGQKTLGVNNPILSTIIGIGTPIGLVYLLSFVISI